MERLVLVKSVSILSSQHIWVEVLFRNPSCSVIESHCCGKSTCSYHSLASSTLSKHVIKVSICLRYPGPEVLFNSEARSHTVGVSGSWWPGPRSSWSVLVWMRDWKSLFSILMATCSQSLILFCRHLSEVKTTNILLTIKSYLNYKLMIC